MLAVDAVRVDVRLVDVVAGEDPVAVEAVVDAVLEMHLDVVAYVLLLDELLAAAQTEVLDPRGVADDRVAALEVLLRERLGAGVYALEARAAQMGGDEVREEGRLAAEPLVTVAAREHVPVQVRGRGTVAVGRPGVRGGTVIVPVVIYDVWFDL